MQLYKTTKGNILFHNDKSFIIDKEWDLLINQENLYSHLLYLTSNSKVLNKETFTEIINDNTLPPIGSQELWGAGVTYLRSRDARMEESKQSGGADFYGKVYEAERPELFFKALPHRVAGHGQEVYIRKDSLWNVPEPELTLFINSSGSIQAYTIGNDMSSRSIEGENPLYLPQAKTYEKSAALGPCLFITEEPIPGNTSVSIEIKRHKEIIFAGSIQLSRMKRTLPELAMWLYKECIFPSGCFLMTGTGIVPADDFTLQLNDEVNISIDGIGTLTNIIAARKTHN
jgi:2-dehydro-3-deoxy-D-arabinonate dehydratase